MNMNIRGEFWFFCFTSKNMIRGIYHYTVYNLLTIFNMLHVALIYIHNIYLTMNEVYVTYIKLLTHDFLEEDLTLWVLKSSVILKFIFRCNKCTIMWQKCFYIKNTRTHNFKMFQVRIFSIYSQEEIKYPKNYYFNRKLLFRISDDLSIYIWMLLWELWVITH